MSGALSFGLCLMLSLAAHAAGLPPPPRGPGDSPRGPRDLVTRVRRVVGGAPLAEGAWPWLASLNYLRDHAYLELQGLDHLCGGTLVAAQWVLTAAHCVHHASGDPGLGEEKNWAIVLGEHDRRSRDAAEQRRGVTAIHVYPGYSLVPQLTGDIALLKLTSPVLVTPYVAPLTVDTARKIPAGSPCRAAGWGQHIGDEHDARQFGNGTFVPHVVDVQRVATKDCQYAYSMQWPQIDDTVLCFDSDKKGDTCKGDSGGPLICLDGGGRAALTGVVSVGMGCAMEGFPGVYTRASAYTQWMADVMGGDWLGRE